ncbi:MAG: cupin domain-containing protein [Pseudohongiellaceae bacterium]
MDRNNVEQGITDSKKKKPLLLEALMAVSAAMILGWLLVGTQTNQTAAQQSNFMGGNPSVENSDEVSTLRLVFPAGVRSNWHSHSWGQLLMVEEGRGLTQDRDGPLLEMHPGEPWWTPAGREHWHGAHPEEDVLQLTIYEGDVNWMEPVTDEVYTATPQRP